MKKLHRIHWPMQLDKLIFSPVSSVMRRYLKKMMGRARRKDGKLNKDDALKTNRYYGYWS